jgi:hypothetical protein
LDSFGAVFLKTPEYKGYSLFANNLGTYKPLSSEELSKLQEIEDEE